MYTVLQAIGIFFFILLTCGSLKETRYISDEYNRKNSGCRSPFLFGYFIVITFTFCIYELYFIVFFQKQKRNQKAKMAFLNINSFALFLSLSLTLHCYAYLPPTTKKRKNFTIKIKFILLFRTATTLYYIEIKEMFYIRL